MMLSLPLAAYSLASSNKVFINFSPSPTHLDVIELADILKNVALHSDATHFAINVLPFPGGPYSNKPEDGDLSPVNISGRSDGKIIVS